MSDTAVPGISPAHLEGKGHTMPEPDQLVSYAAPIADGTDGPVDIGQIGLATALSWLEFRELPDFRTKRPRLARWYEDFSQRPSMRATAYHGETQDGPTPAAIAG